MLWDEKALRENLRNREGRRVFYLPKGDQLTSAARDWLRQERVELLPAETARPQRFRLLTGGFTEEKGEDMTHLNREVLVKKTHPRIVFRGKMDTLEGELLLCQYSLPALAGEVGEVLELARRILRCDVLEEPLGKITLWGLGEEELRRRSHFPQEYYGQPHFMPAAGDGAAVLGLNRARCAAREAELAAVNAFSDREGKLTRADLPAALNRMSSMLYLLMIREKGRE